MSGPQDNVDRTLQRPDHQLAADVPDQAAVEQLVAGLSGLGLDVAQLQVLHGARGGEILDVAGEHHGWRFHVGRAFKSNGVDGNMLAAYDEALRDGRFLVLVPLPESQPREAVVDVLLRHGAEHVNYFGSGTMETIY